MEGMLPADSFTERYLIRHLEYRVQKQSTKEPSCAHHWSAPGSIRRTWWRDTASYTGWAEGLDSRFLTSACSSTSYLSLKSAVCCKNLLLLSAHLQVSSCKQAWGWGPPSSPPTPHSSGASSTPFSQRRALQVQLPCSGSQFQETGHVHHPWGGGVARAKLINGRAVDEGAQPRAIHHCRLPGPVSLQMEKEMM